MPTTYEPIATTTLGSFANTISFTSIPSTYTDLRVVLYTKFLNSNTDLFIRFNNDSGTNYSTTYLYGTGSTATSILSTNSTQGNLGTLRNANWQMATVDVLSYADSTFKPLLSRAAVDMGGAGTVWNTVNVWRSTTAINRLDLIPNNTNELQAGTMATLYGIKRA